MQLSALHAGTFLQAMRFGGSVGRSAGLHRLPIIIRDILVPNLLKSAHFDTAVTPCSDALGREAGAVKEGNGETDRCSILIIIRERGGI